MADADSVYDRAAVNTKTSRLKHDAISAAHGGGADKIGFE